jgi:pyridoxamine 5'-phosphate oxidase
LAENPRASGALAWLDAGRQLVVSGDVVRESDEVAAATYLSRTRYLQLLAWANTADTAQQSSAERQARWSALSMMRPQGSLVAPPAWAEFVLRPSRLTFWRGDPDGPSHRVEYRRESTSTSWSVTQLPG